MCNGTGNTLDDIVIIFSRESEAAGLWAPYLSTCFDQSSQQRAPRNPFKVLHMPLEDLSAGVGTNMEERLASVKLQIIILCPTFTSLISDSSSKCAEIFSRIFQPDRALGMLLGLTENDIDVNHKTVLSSYHNWKRIAVKDQDPTLIREFLDCAMTIISRVARQQYFAAQQEKSQFSVIPKKVKTGHRRVIVLLNEPLQRDDNIKVSVDKSGEMIEINPVSRRNPYTLQFSIPKCCLEASMIINVIVEKNGSILGNQPVKCESRLRELDQLLRTNDSPVEFMCQALSFPTGGRDQLDSFMVHAFQRNVPPHFNLMMPNGPGVINPQKTTPEEFPTLLHFAARYGLEKFAWQLLQCPGGEQACEMRNACDLTPAEIAENAGHTRLAQDLRGHMQMNEFTNMYHMLKGMTIKNESTENNDEYLLPRPFGETYSVPPSARPFTPPTTLPLTITGYMEMNGKNTPSPKSTTSSIDITPTSPQSPLTLPSFTPPKKEIYHYYTNTLRKQLDVPPKPVKIIEDHVQSELADIIHDFKNNVFTIQEVEQLVENWRNRNDVQQSFKDKQETLVKMREEYERVQKLMKDDMRKAATPFDRLKRFFSRSKSKNEESSKDTSQASSHSSSNGTSCHRPVSSLSQSSSSSSSSARMSTASGCSGISFGDSGTHSDVEDRKHLFTFHSNLDQQSTGTNYNYLIPPTPKPIFKYGTSSSERISPQSTWKFKSIEEQNSVQEGLKSDVNNTSKSNEFYIQFPPSGMPVQMDGKLDQIKETDLIEESSNFNKKSEEYINIAAGIAQKELEDQRFDDNEDNDDVNSKLLHEYMNFQPINGKNNKNLPPLKPKRNI